MLIVVDVEVGFGVVGTIFDVDVDLATFHPRISTAAMLVAAVTDQVVDIQERLAACAVYETI